jgi:hypothetical protein
MGCAGQITLLMKELAIDRAGLRARDARIARQGKKKERKTN